MHVGLCYAILQRVLWSLECLPQQDNEWMKRNENKTVETVGVVPEVQSELGRLQAALELQRNGRIDAQTPFQTLERSLGAISFCYCLEQTDSPNWTAVGFSLLTQSSLRFSLTKVYGPTRRLRVTPSLSVLTL